MAYIYDASDFKKFLYDKNPKYRVDGLTFWQNRIPIPIDLFNRIFDESDIIIAEYVQQLTASAIVFSQSASFEQEFGITVDKLPCSELKNHRIKLIKWLDDVFEKTNIYRNFHANINDNLGIKNSTFGSLELANSLTHQGKKYARLWVPDVINEELRKFPKSYYIGKDNTDMFGNIIADRYNIYRSGFSDALSIIFNCLIEFRLKFSDYQSSFQRINLTIEESDEIKVVSERTQDGSLWEPGYDDDHLVKINPEHPFIRSISSNNTHLSELLYYLSEFESRQFSDSQRKIIENMRQEVSRNLWIKYD